jgi:hypothetical protein
LRAALEQPSIEIKRVISLLESARLEGVVLDSAMLEFAYRESLEHLADAFVAEPSLAALETLSQSANALPYLPFAVDLWKVQNLFYDVLQRHYPSQQRAQLQGDETIRRWITCFQSLGQLLRVKVRQEITGGARAS